jgi:hypothetical protein
LFVASVGPDVTASVEYCHIENSERAGFTVFGTTAHLAASALRCNPIHLAQEPYEGRSALLVDEGGNTCACGAEVTECQAVSAGLEPPESVDPNEP